MVMQQTSFLPRPLSSNDAHLSSSGVITTKQLWPEHADFSTTSNHAYSGSSPRVSRVRQVTFSPWGYHAGCHGSPVIMSPGGQLSRPSSSKSNKRLLGFDKKHMILPSPASFAFKESRSQTSLSNHNNPHPTATTASIWTTQGRTETPLSNEFETAVATNPQTRRGELQEQQSRIHFRRSSLPNPEASSSPIAGGQGQKPKSGQRSRNPSGSSSSRNRPPLKVSSSFSDKLPFSNAGRHMQPSEFQISGGLMVTSMRLNERPKSKGGSKKTSSSEEDSLEHFSAKKSSKPNSRRDSLINNLVKQRTVEDKKDDHENEMFLNLATQIDEKFYLEQQPVAPPPKVEIFVKRLSSSAQNDADDLEEEDYEEEDYDEEDS